MNNMNSMNDIDMNFNINNNNNASQFDGNKLMFSEKIKKLIVTMDINILHHSMTPCDLFANYLFINYLMICVVVNEYYDVFALQYNQLMLLIVTLMFVDIQLTFEDVHGFWYSSLH